MLTFYTFLMCHIGTHIHVSSKGPGLNFTFFRAGFVASRSPIR